MSNKEFLLFGLIAGVLIGVLGGLAFFTYFVPQIKITTDSLFQECLANEGDFYIADYSNYEDIKDYQARCNIPAKQLWKYKIAD